MNAPQPHKLHLLQMKKLGLQDWPYRKRSTRKTMVENAEVRYWLLLFKVVVDSAGSIPETAPGVMQRCCCRPSLAAVVSWCAPVLLGRTGGAYLSQLQFAMVLFDPSPPLVTIPFPWLACPLSSTCSCS